jgi:predicted permease
MIARLRALLNALFHRRRYERELDDELAFHLDCRSAQLQAEGLDAAEARRRARVELGMRELHADAARRARGLAPFDRLLMATRHAWRGLSHSPGFALTAVSVLAVPLAAGVILYALFAAYALHTPPLERVERWVYAEGHDATGRLISNFHSDEAAALLADPPPALEGLYSHRGATLPLHGLRPAKGMGAAVSDNFFRLTGVPPRLGRLWLGDDDPRDADTVVLTERGWHKLFDGAPDVVGRSLQIGGRSFAVIGVTGRDYSGIMPIATLYYLRAEDYASLHAEDDPNLLDVEVGGFVRSDGSVEAASSALAARAAALTVTRDPDLQLVRIGVVPREGVLRAADREEMLLAGLPVALAVLLMMAVAAANLANLLLARHAARRHDLAVRAALGAGRLRLFAHLLGESLLLALIAGLLALLLAALLMPPIHNQVFGLLAEMGYDLLQVRLDASSLLFALGLALFAALLFGGLPAWWMTAPWAGRRAGKPDAAALKRGEPRGLRGLLMGVQVAASVFLIVLAGLIAGNARDAERVALGFDPRPLVSVRGAVDGGRLAEHLRRQPGVLAVSATSAMPFMRGLPRVAAVRDGRSDVVQLRYVDAHWWSALGVAPRAGRGFSAHEPADAPIAVVSARAASLLWPEGQPLGRSLQLRVDDDSGTPLLDRRVEVVGVADDLATGWLFGDPLRAVVYLPATAGSEQAPTLLLRLRDASPQAVAAVHRACAELAGEVDCNPLRLSDAVRIQQAPFAVARWLATAIAWVALAISCVGLYGLVGYAVVQQRRALGVRLALGAQRRDVIRHVMRGAVRPIIVGVLVGLPLALLLARVIASLTDRLRTVDLQAFVVDPLLLVAIALLAAWLPARRSATIPPSESLRAEG